MELQKNMKYPVPFVELEAPHEKFQEDLNCTDCIYHNIDGGFSPCYRCDGVSHFLPAEGL